MVKRVLEKQRGKIGRKVKKMILIGLEGKNVTEAQYFNHFNKITNNYRIIFGKGNSTNPIGIVEETIKTIGDCDFDRKLGDKAYCLIDTDYGKDREQELIKAIKLAEKHQINILLTNPTFEVWFLLHFRYSTKQYSNNNEVIIELRKYIPKYEKSTDVFDVLFSLLETALNNADSLDEYHNSNNALRIMEKCPSTQVKDLIRLILKDDK